MKLRLLITMIAALAAMLVVGCNDNDSIVEQERTSIERYLTSSHSPRLISKADVENSLEFNPPFYERLSQDVYRYIATYYDADRDLRREVEQGDVVSMTVTAYQFTGSKPSVAMVYFTNEQSVIASLEELGLNTQYWTSEPLVLKLGETNIIKGVSMSLLGCREGDQVEVYMTHEAAYGKDAVGVLEKESSVLWVYTIDSVTKN